MRSSSTSDLKGGDGLRLLGQPMFVTATVVELLGNNMRPIIAREFEALRLERAPISQLQVRRRLAEHRMGVPARLIGPGTLHLTVQRGPTLEAELRVGFAGEPAWFRIKPEAGNALRVPKGRIQRNQLVLAAAFPRDDAPFAGPLLQAELDLVDRVLNQLAFEVEELNKGIAPHIKALVAAEWPKLTSR